MTDGVADALNRLWTVERALIDQYVARAKVCEARGEHRIANLFRSYAFTEMRDVSSMIDRVIQIGGAPELQQVDRVELGQTIDEQIALSIDGERKTIAAIEGALAVCEAAGDDETSARLRDDLVVQREHIAQLESVRAERRSDGLVQPLR